MNDLSKRRQIPGLPGVVGIVPLGRRILTHSENEGPMYGDDHDDIERGSWVLLQAADRKGAVDLLQRDPFTVGKVWDWDKAQILSVKSGLRVPFVKSSINFPKDKMNGSV